jgi:hydroxyacylglutathione hydrolase
VKSFITYAGTVLPYDRDLYLIASNGDDVDAIVNDLSLIGLDRVKGAHALNDRSSLDGAVMRSLPQIDIDSLAEHSRELTVLDVRRDDEWEEGHIPGAIHIPLGSLSQRLAEIPRDKKIAVHCQGGTRSAIAASILERNGINASNVPGGFGEWVARGKTIEREGAAQK